MKKSLSERVCACGCGQVFNLTKPNRKYFDKATCKEASRHLRAGSERNAKRRAKRTADRAARLVSACNRCAVEHCEDKGPFSFHQVNGEKLALCTFHRVPLLHGKRLFPNEIALYDTTDERRCKAEWDIKLNLYRDARLISDTSLRSPLRNGAVHVFTDDEDNFGDEVQGQQEWQAAATAFVTSITRELALEALCPWEYLRVA